jgi:acyl-CoA synthetase (AMP-forming)/AMP-acid ligase II
MSNPLYAFPPVCAQTLRALKRYPSRTAFSWPGGSLSYQGATDLIGRIQGVFSWLGLESGARVAFLTANRADSWCAGVAAQLSRLAITWLHPLGSLDDQLFQLEDSEAQMLVVDAAAFRERGGELAARASSHEASGIKTVFTLGPADYGVDLLAAIEQAGHATARSFAQADDIATLNYTGGTTGKSKGALRTHREYGGFANAILADFEIPDGARYLTVAPISHVAGTKVLPTLMRGGTVHMLKGFDPEAVFNTIARERIDFTLFVPTMIYVLLDHPALGKTDLSSLELVLYGASAMSPSRLVEGIERIGPVFSQLYGQTECYPVSVLRKEDHDPKTPELRFPDRRLRGEDPRRGRPRGRNRRGGRNLRARTACDGRILETAGDHRGDAEERLAAHRRHRARRRARLHVHPRPQEGHDRLRRLQHLPARGGGRAVAASGCRDVRRGRRARRQMGRGRHRGRGGARGRPPQRRRTDRPGEIAQGLGACAEADPVRHGIADDRRRQGRQEGAARNLLGRPRPDGGVGSDVRLTTLREIAATFLNASNERLAQAATRIGSGVGIFSAAQTTSAAGAEPCCIEGSQGPAALGFTRTRPPSTR